MVAGHRWAVNSLAVAEPWRGAELEPAKPVARLAPEVMSLANADAT